MRYFFTLGCLTLASSFIGCGVDIDASDEGVKIKAPGVDIDVSKDDSVKIKAPGADVSVNKEEGTEIEAGGVEVKVKNEEPSQKK